MSTARIPTHSVVIALALLLGSTGVAANCWEEASAAYSIPIDVLKGVAKTESGFKTNAQNTNKNGTTDLGMMQINSDWLPELKKFGIDREALLSDACLNLKVGAWILSSNIKRLGWNWDAIGAYNVGCKKLSALECKSRRADYAWKVHSSMLKVASLEGGSPAPTHSPEMRISPKPLSNPTQKIVVVSMDAFVNEVVAVADDHEVQDEGPHGFFFYQEAE